MEYNKGNQIVHVPVSIIHNAVFTKEKFFKANILQDNKCFHCKDKAETLLHLLVHCPLTVAFWNDFREWWRKKYPYCTEPYTY